MEESCIYGAGTLPTFAVWGDSHAIELSYALGEVAKRHRRSILQFTYSSCAGPGTRDQHPSALPRVQR
jgi:hypothetical protein